MTRATGIIAAGLDREHSLRPPPLFGAAVVVIARPLGSPQGRTQTLQVQPAIPNESMANPFARIGASNAIWELCGRLQSKPFAPAPTSASAFLRMATVPWLTVPVLRRGDKNALLEVRAHDGRAAIPTRANQNMEPAKQGQHNQREHDEGNMGMRA